MNYRLGSIDCSAHELEYLTRSYLDQRYLSPPPLIITRFFAEE